MSNRFTALILGLMLVAGCLPLTAQTYTFQQLTIPYAPNADVWANGINNRGAIVGTFLNNRHAHKYRGFKRDANGVLESPIDKPNSNFYTSLTGVNDNGVIVGFSNWAFLLYKGAFIDYFGPPYLHTPRAAAINGINNKGDFVGATRTDGGGGQHWTIFRAWARINGTVVKFECPRARFLDSLRTIPAGIAADGTIVGTCSKNGIPVGFIRGPAGQYQLLQVPGADSTHFNAINNVTHQIVGYYTTQGTAHGVVYDYLTDAVTTVDWPDPNTQQSYITGINSHGVIVGYAAVNDAQGNALPVLSFIGTPQ